MKVNRYLLRDTPGRGGPQALLTPGQASGSPGRAHLQRQSAGHTPAGTDAEGAPLLPSSSDTTAQPTSFPKSREKTRALSLSTVFCAKRASRVKSNSVFSFGLLNLFSKRFCLRALEASVDCPGSLQEGTSHGASVLQTPSSKFKPNPLTT